MKKMILILSLPLCFLFACSKPAVKETVSKPAIKKEEFLYFMYRGKAKTVFLSGNFNNWKTDDKRFGFSQEKPGVWKLRVPHSFVKKGKNEYKLIVNGEWILDPSAKKFENSSLSGKIGVFYVQ